MALRYWVGSGSTSNWNATGPTNWGSQSGVPSNASVPTNLDDVIFDGAGLSGQSNAIISAAANIKSLTIENSYTGTIGHNAVLTVSSTGNLGNLTLSTGYTITGTSALQIGKDCTISSRGRTWPNSLTLGTGSSLTVTLSGSDFNIGGIISCTSASPLTFNATGNSIVTSGGITTITTMAGNGNVVIRGGVVSCGAGTTSSLTNLIFDGGCIIGTSSSANNLNLSSGRIVYSSGTVDVTTFNSNLRFLASVTADTSGMSWNNVIVDTTANSVLVSDLNINGLFTQGSNGTVGTFNTNNNSKVFLYNGALLFAPMNSGTADIYLKGGIWRGNDSTSAFQNNLFIDGNVTLSGANVNYGGRTLRYLSGNVILTGATPTTPTLGIRSGCTLDISAITLNNFTNYNSANIITLNGDLNISGLCSINTTATINTGTTNAVIDIYSGMSINAGLGGTAKILFYGGSWSQTSTAYAVTNNLDILGNVTITGSNPTYGTGILTHVSGNVNVVHPTGSTFNINGNCTLNTSGITWNNFRFVGVNNTTLNSNLNVNGLLTVNSTTRINTGTTSTVVNLYSGMSINAGLGGTAKILFSGGPWVQGATTYAVGNNLDIVNNVQISGANPTYSAGTLNYISGNVITTGSTFNIFSSCTLNTSGMSWNNVSTIGTNVTTLNSDLNCNGFFTIGATTTITGNTSAVINTNSGLTINTTTITLGNNLNSYGRLLVSATSTVNTGNTPTSINLYSGMSINAALAGTVRLIFSGGTWIQGANTYGIANNLDITGNVTITGTTTTYGGGTLRYLSGNVTTTTGSTLNIRASSTFDTSGMSWNTINFLGINTLTLNSDLNINNLLTITSTTTINTGTTLATVNLFSGLTLNAGLGGTGAIDLRGGIWSQGATTYALGCNLDIDGNVQLSGANLTYSANTLRYVSGIPIVTGSTLNLRSNCTLDTSGMTWNNITITATNTTTLNSNLNIGGLFTVGAAATTTINTGRTNAVVNLYSGMSINAGTSGTARLVFSGGTWVHGANTYGIGNSLDIAGNVIITGITTTYGGGTLRYISGNVTITTASTLNIRASSTFDTSGMSWNTINLLGSNVLTLNSDLNINNLFLFSASTTANTGTTLAAINLFSGLTVNSTLTGNGRIRLRNGNWGQNATTYGLGVNVDIDGNIGITGANHTYSAGTLNYISGNVITTGSTFNIFSSCTLNTSGITWNNFRFIGTNTTTLNSNLNVGNLFTINANTTINTGTTNAVINLYSGMSINANLRGNAKLIFSAGTWAQGATTYSVENSMDIIGDIRITGASATYGGGNGILRYISGNAIATGSTFNIFSSCTLDTSGMTWNSVRTNGITILNLISDLNVRGPFNIISALNVTGNTGAAVNALTGVTANTSAAITLNNNINSYGLVTVSTTSIINSGTTSGAINIFSGLTLNAGTSGTGRFVIKNGTWSQGANTYVMGNVLEIDGNMSIGSNTALGSNGTLKYVSGNPILSGSTIIIRSNCNFDTSGFTLGLISAPVTSTITIFSNLCARFNITANNVNLTVNSARTNSVVSCYGIVVVARTNTINGNVPFYLTGGTYSMFTGPYNIVLNNDTYINGNVNLVAFNWSGNSNKILKYLSGTVTATDLALGGSTVAGEWAYVDIGYNVVASNNINVSPGNLYLISPIKALANLGLSSGGNYVFDGVAGFFVDYIWVVSTNNSENYSSMNLILKADPNIEYFVNTLVIRTGNSGALVIRSNTPGVRAKFTKLRNIIASTNAEFRDIDNSNGYLFGTFANPISAFTNNNCLNIKHYQDIPTITSQIFSY